MASQARHQSAQPPTTEHEPTRPAGEGQQATRPVIDIATHHLAGGPAPATGNRLIESVDPSTGRRVGSVIAATTHEVDQAVRGARDALPGWRRTPPAARAAALREAAADLRARREQLAALHTLDTGRLRRDALGAVDAAAGLLAEAAEHGPLDAGRALASGPAAVDLVRREPRGVVGVLTPWNDPYPVAAGLIAAATVTGNVVVHKPSERSPLAGWAFATLLAGHLPPGVLTVLSGDAATGEAIVSHPGVDAVAHVGSSATGHRIRALAAARGAHLVLENGGSDVLVVDEGVDPVAAAREAALGAFANAGQLCVSVELVVVLSSVAEAFLSALVEEAGAWWMGRPDDESALLGPLVDERMVSAVEQQVDEAVRAGARVLTGGARPSGRPGAWYPATVLADCAPGMAVWDEETFGPVAPVRVVQTFAEALDVADEGAYGLAATVLTPRLDHALEAAERLDVGTVKVNAVFGGAPGGSADPRGISGTGRGYGPDLLAELTVLKTIHLGLPPR